MLVLKVLKVRRGLKVTPEPQVLKVQLAHKELPVPGSITKELSPQLPTSLILPPRVSPSMSVMWRSSTFTPLVEIGRVSAQSWVLRVPKVLKVPLVLQDLLVLRDFKAQLAPKVSKVSLVRLVLQALQVQLALRVFKELLELPAPKALLALLELKVLLALLAPKALQA